ncbi:MAG: hypothetical protein WA160_16830 [Pseudobdellovibrio sp.]
MKKTGKIAVFIMTAGIVSLCYQNCSKVPLTMLGSQAVILEAKGTGDLCFQNDIQNYTMTSFYVTNVNSVNRLGGLEPDTDADGISDSEELKYDFNPANRRSRSNLLDSICLQAAGSNQCQNLIPSCNSSEYKMGLSDCDLKVLGLNSVVASSDPGIDTDGDNIPDFIEVLRGTNPKIADSLSDPDNDGILNTEEISMGSDPVHYESEVPADIRIYANMNRNNKVDPLKPCSGERWSLKVDRIPFMKVPAFTDSAIKISPDAINFSHKINENVVIVWIKLVPKAGFSGLPKMYFKTLKINAIENIFSLTMDDFKLMGEVAQ